MEAGARGKGGAGRLDDGDWPPEGGTESFEVLAGMDGARVERILSPASPSPGAWYEQGHDEWVMVFRGRAELRLEAPDERVVLGPGEWLWLAAGRRHRVERVFEPTGWLAVHGREKERA